MIKAGFLSKKEDKTKRQRSCCTFMDDKNNVGAPDRNLINTNENYEVEYWSEKFNVTPEQLKEAVSKVGNSADAVEQALKNK